MVKHALLSASGASRWLACPKSARLEENFPDEQSPYAAEGTQAHDLAEQLLQWQLAGKAEKEFPLPFPSQEMADAVSDYVAICLEKINEARKRSSDAVVMVEERLDFSDYVPEGFGTGDLVLVSDDLLEVVDLKYGKGVPVSAEGNSQMRLYALGALSRYSLLYDIKSVRMTIVQPRLDSVSAAELTVEELEAWGDSVKPLAEKAFKGEGDCIPGRHCGFCKVRHLCRTLAEHCLAEAGELQPTDLLNDVEVARVLDQYDTLKKWLEDVKRYALDQAVNGKEWTGYKVVEGTSRRTIVDTETAIKSLADNEYRYDDYMKTPELRGITDLTKLLGKKKLKEILGDLIEKPPGKPTLVPLEDKRAPMVLDTVTADDFEDL